MKEKRLAEAAEWRRQKENSVIIKAPGQAKRRVMKKTADQLEGEHGSSIYPKENRESPRKVAKTTQNQSPGSQKAPNGKGKK